MGDMKHSKLFRKYADKIKTSTLSEQDIRSLRSILNGWRRTSIADSEKTDLINMIYNHAPRVSPEQSDKGIACLMNQWKNPTGHVRKNNPFGKHETHVLENFDHFTFSGLYNAMPRQRTSQGFYNWLPVYTVYATDGSAFQYVAGSWESGERLQIIG